MKKDEMVKEIECEIEKKEKRACEFGYIDKHNLALAIYDYIQKITGIPKKYLAKENTMTATEIKEKCRHQKR